MKFLFILDPLDSLKSHKDTSLAIMREAEARSHELYVCKQHDVFLRNEIVNIKAQKFQFTTAQNWYALSESEEFLPNRFDAILMRKDPPFDNE